MNNPVGRNDIAIVGAACRLPDADNPGQFWNNLVSAKDSIREVPKQRFDWQAYEEAKGERRLSRWGAFLDRLEYFDAAFFKVSPREARLMDPQQRLLMMVAWEAIEDAGYRMSELPRSETGVFVGACH